MVSRRHQSNISEETPVRLYKIIALSFLALTIILLGLVVFMSSKRVEIVITTKPDPVDATVDIAIGASGSPDIGAVSTSTLVDITRSFQPSGGREEPGVATGMVTIYNETSGAQPLVATTRLLSPDGVLFRLKNRVTVPARGSVSAEVYADKEGTGTNVPPTTFTIPGLNAEKQKVIYGKSESPMSSGVRRIGVLSESDIDTAIKAMLEALLEEGKKALSGAYEGKTAVFLASSDHQQLDEQSFKSDTPAGAETDRFSMRGRARVSAVFYDAEKLNAVALQALEKKSVGDTELLEPGKEPPTVRLLEMNPATGAGTLSVVKNGRAVLNPESRQIDKAMFFGKTKDEVRRYLLSLKHVHAVEVKFRPLWMVRVPHVPDHVQVVVKNVE